MHAFPYEGVAEKEEVHAFVRTSLFGERGVWPIKAARLTTRATRPYFTFVREARVEVVLWHKTSERAVYRRT